MCGGGQKMNCLFHKRTRFSEAGGHFSAKELKISRTVGFECFKNSGKINSLCTSFEIVVISSWVEFGS